MESSATNQKTKKTFLKMVLTSSLLIGCAFICLALISYNPYDPAINSATTPPNLPTNLAGHIGASVVGFYVFYLGLGAFLVPAMLLSIAKNLYSTHTKLYSCCLYYLFLYAILFCLFTPVVGAFSPTFYTHGLEVSSLGVVGTRFLDEALSFTGQWGALCLATSGLAVWAYLFFTPVLSLNAISNLKLFHKNSQS